MKHKKSTVGEFLLPYLDTSPLRLGIVSLLASVQEGQGVDQLTGLLSTLKKDAAITKAVVSALRNHGESGRRALHLFQQGVDTQRQKLHALVKRGEARRQNGMKRTVSVRHISRLAYLTRLFEEIANALAHPAEQQHPKIADFETLARRLIALIQGQPRSKRSGRTTRNMLRAVLRSVLDMLQADGAVNSLRRLARDREFGLDALLRLDPSHDSKAYAKIATLHAAKPLTRTEHERLYAMLGKCGIWGQAVLRKAYRSARIIRAKAVLMQSAPVSQEDVVSLLTDELAAPALRVQAALRVGLDSQGISLLLNILANPRTARRLADAASRRLATLGSSMLLQVINRAGSVQSRKALHRLDHLRRKVTGEVVRQEIGDSFATIFPAPAAKKVTARESILLRTTTHATTVVHGVIPVAQRTQRIPAAVSPHRVQVESFRRNRLYTECRAIVANGLREGAIRAAKFVRAEAQSLSTTFNTGLDRLFERIHSQREAIQFALATVSALWRHREIRAT